MYNIFIILDISERTVKIKGTLVQNHEKKNRTRKGGEVCIPLGRRWSQRSYQQGKTSLGCWRRWRRIRPHHQKCGDFQKWQRLRELLIRRWKQSPIPGRTFCQTYLPVMLHYQPVICAITSSTPMTLKLPQQFARAVVPSPS